MGAARRVSPRSTASIAPLPLPLLLATLLASLSLLLAYPAYGQVIGGGSGQQLSPCTSNLPSVFFVPPSASFTTLISVPTQCTAPRVAVSLAPKSGTAVVQGSNTILYMAGNATAMDLFFVTLSCGDSNAPLCMDTINVNVAPTVAPTPQPTPPPTPVPTFPRCADDGSQIAVSQVNYQGSLTVPTTGGCTIQYQAISPLTATFFLMNVTSGSYIFSMGPAGNTQATVSFATTCLGVLQCLASVTFVYSTPAPPPVPQCPTAFLSFVVPPSTVTGFVANFNQNCPSGMMSGQVLTQPTSPSVLTFLQGLNFMFSAPPQTDQDYSSTVQITCNGVPLCTGILAFQVSTQTLLVTPQPSTAAPTPIPTAAPSTSMPATASPPVASCGPSLVFSIGIGSILQFNSSYPQPAGCPAVTYRAAPSPLLLGVFQVNLIGVTSYTPPLTEAVDQFAVDVSCMSVFLCRTSVIVNVFRPITPAPPPISPAPPTLQPSAAPIGVCPSVYYYFTQPSGSISNSLRGMPGESFCVNGRFFTLIYSPAVGSLSPLSLLGDFSYQAPSGEAVAAFGFQMGCLGVPVCQGSAYITVSRAVTLAPPLAPPGGNNGNTPQVGTKAPVATNAPPVRPSSPQITCAGTCSQNAWKVMANQPQVWDDTPDQSGGFSHVTPRKDGRAVGSIDVDWVNGSLVLRTYTIIGNLAARFPTFEPITYSPGQMLAPSDLSAQVNPQSLGFDQTCLANQGTGGTSMDVWYYTSYTNLTGSLGAYYANGLSWYQKLGGKHVNCDTFGNACRYAPLLTPRPASPDFGAWSLDVSDCDATWTGVFSFAALRNLVTINNVPVWSIVGFRQLGATIIAEAVKPRNFFQPELGFVTSAVPHPLAFDLRQWPTVVAVDQVLFSFDLEYFEYGEDNGDRAFGINMIVLPYVDNAGAVSNYSPDRHIRGFKWLTQNWIAPTNAQCPTCTGIKTQCNVPMNKAFPRDFLAGDCPPGTPRIQLRKGPSFGAVNCTADNMHIFDTPGFSMPTSCTTAYQNLTLRGVAVGSRFMNQDQLNAMTYEGTVGMRFLMDNGVMPIVNINLGLFVARLAQDNNVQGALNLCRASPYYPVLDPLGQSTPEQPHKLSPFAAVTGFMCVDPLSRVFGPSGWATMWITVPSAVAVRVKDISLTYGNRRVILYYADPNSGQSMVSPPGAGYWWQQYFPYLNFRALSSSSGGSLSTAPNVDPIPGSFFAFALTPGMLGVTGQVEILANCIVSAPNASGVVVNSSTMFRRRLNLDPKLSFVTRNGVRPAKKITLSASDQSILLFAAAVIGGLVVLSVLILNFGGGELPWWVPVWILNIVPKRKSSGVKEPVPADAYDVFRIESSSKKDQASYN